MQYIYIGVAIILIVSAIADLKKTIKGLQLAFKNFSKILPAFVTMLIFISLILFFIPDKLLVEYLGMNNKYFGMIVGAIFGSITVIPGFIAFPLCGILLKKGVAYITLSSFSTTLMMVGLLTYPIEKTYFGHKITIIRNLISFVIAIVIAIVTGILFGEIF
jgi:uncharacterized membrane protein YraQ (UPF0718 family)